MPFHLVDLQIAIHIRLQLIYSRKLTHRFHTYFPIQLQYKGIQMDQNWIALANHFDQKKLNRRILAKINKRGKKIPKYFN